jgi:hypothetical protein
MPIPLIETPQALDAAIVAGRRENLLRGVRNQRIRMRIALGLSGCAALCALAAYLIGDSAAARFCAVTACTAVVFTYVAGAAARKKAVDALREADQPK